MRRPGDTTPPPAGGRVAARQRMFTEQRLPASGSAKKETTPAGTTKKTRKTKKRKKTKKTKKTKQR